MKFYSTLFCSSSSSCGILNLIVSHLFSPGKVFTPVLLGQVTLKGGELIKFPCATPCAKSPNVASGRTTLKTSSAQASHTVHAATAAQSNDHILAMKVTPWHPKTGNFKKSSHTTWWPGDDLWLTKWDDPPNKNEASLELIEWKFPGPPLFWVSVPQWVLFCPVLPWCFQQWKMTP